MDFFHSIKYKKKLAILQSVEKKKQSQSKNKITNIFFYFMKFNQWFEWRRKNFGSKLIKNMHPSSLSQNLDRFSDGKLSSPFHPIVYSIYVESK